MEEEAGFGPHFLLDGYKCKRDSLIDLNHVFDFLDKTPERIGMKKISQPYVFKYQGDEPLDWGVTGTVIIATSHCSIHTFPDRNGFVSIDIYSCQNFDTDEVLNTIKEYFQPEYFDMTVLIRGTKFSRSVEVKSE